MVAEMLHALVLGVTCSFAITSMRKVSVSLPLLVTLAVKVLLSLATALMSVMFTFLYDAPWMPV